MLHAKCQILSNSMVLSSTFLYKYSYKYKKYLQMTHILSIFSNKLSNVLFSLQQ